MLSVCATLLQSAIREMHPKYSICQDVMQTYTALTAVQVDGADCAEGLSDDGLDLVVRASGLASLPDYSAGGLPDRSRTAYLAVTLLMEYIMSLQPEGFNASADTHVQGESTISSRHGIH